MDLRLSHFTLAVHDIDEAVRFYREVLGFELRDDTEFEGTRWVSVGPPSQPEVHIVLEPPDPRSGDSSHRLVFATDDCDATFARIESAGAEVMQEPIDQPYGVRDCAFSDPSGNLLRFTQTRSAG